MIDDPNGYDAHLVRAWFYARNGDEVYIDVECEFNLGPKLSAANWQQNWEHIDAAARHVFLRQHPGMYKQCKWLLASYQLLPNPVKL